MKEQTKLLRRYKERREKLRAVGCPWVDNPSRTPKGTLNALTTDEALYWDYVAGVIDLHVAAQQFHACGWDNFVNETATVQRFQNLDKKYNKLQKV